MHPKIFQKFIVVGPSTSDPREPKFFNSIFVCSTNKYRIEKLWFSRVTSRRPNNNEFLENFKLPHSLIKLFRPPHIIFTSPPTPPTPTPLQLKFWKQVHFCLVSSFFIHTNDYYKRLNYFTVNLVILHGAGNSGQTSIKCCDPGCDVETTVVRKL